MNRLRLNNKVTIVAVACRYVGWSARTFDCLNFVHRRILNQLSQSDNVDLKQRRSA
jgi:hypothetical protein